MNFFQFERPISSVGPETIINISGFHIANTTLFLLLIAVFLILFSYLVVRRFKMVPKGVQSVVESVYEWITALVTQITGNEERSKKIFPVIAALFLFILFSNFIGLIPGLSSFTYEGKAIFRTPTSDFNTTVALALGSILTINIISMKEWGFFGYLGKFFKFKEIFLGFKKSFSAGALACVDFFIGLLDIVGELAKVVSLSLRLFGNMYAGDVLMAILIGSFAYFVPSLWLAMSMLSSVVQAIVFTSLVTVFYTLSVKNT